MPVWMRCYNPNCVNARAGPYAERQGFCGKCQDFMTDTSWSGKPLDPMAGIPHADPRERILNWLQGVQQPRGPLTQHRPRNPWWGPYWMRKNGESFGSIGWKKHGRKRIWMHDVTLIPKSMRNCYVTVTSICRLECFKTYIIILAFDLIEVEFGESKP